MAASGVRWGHASIRWGTKRWAERLLSYERGALNIKVASRPQQMQLPATRPAYQIKPSE